MTIKSKIKKRKAGVSAEDLDGVTNILSNLSDQELDGTRGESGSHILSFSAIATTATVMETNDENENYNNRSHQPRDNLVGRKDANGNDIENGNTTNSKENNRNNSSTGIDLFSPASSAIATTRTTNTSTSAIRSAETFDAATTLTGFHKTVPGSVTQHKSGPNIPFATVNDSAYTFIGKANNSSNNSTVKATTTTTTKSTKSSTTQRNGSGSVTMPTLALTCTTNDNKKNMIDPSFMGTNDKDNAIDLTDLQPSPLSVSEGCGGIGNTYFAPNVSLGRNQQNNNMENNNMNNNSVSVPRGRGKTLVHVTKLLQQKIEREKAIEMSQRNNSDSNKRKSRPDAEDGRLGGGSGLAVSTNHSRTTPSPQELKGDSNLRCGNTNQHTHRRSFQGDANNNNVSNSGMGFGHSPSLCGKGGDHNSITYTQANSIYVPMGGNPMKNIGGSSIHSFMNNGMNPSRGSNVMNPSGRRSGTGSGSTHTRDHRIRTSPIASNKKNGQDRNPNDYYSETVPRNLNDNHQLSNNDSSMDELLSQLNEMRLELDNHKLQQQQQQPQQHQQQLQPYGVGGIVGPGWAASPFYVSGGLSNGGHSQGGFWHPQQQQQPYQNQFQPQPQPGHGSYSQNHRNLGTTQYEQFPQTHVQTPSQANGAPNGTPLVSEWEAFTATCGRTYYWNHKYKVPTWDKPAGM